MSKLLNKDAIIAHRLTALWALNECGLGGFLHVLSPAFTGLVVGGFTLIILGLLCRMAHCTFKQMIQSLLIVLAVKMILSPHSSPTAYIAVSFQSIVAYAVFSLPINTYLASISIGVLTMLESALQKLLVLTLLYGLGFWKAVDQWSSWIVEKLSISRFDSSDIIKVYFLIYAFGGIIFGYYTAKIIITIKKEDPNLYALNLDISKTQTIQKIENSGQSLKKLLFLLFGIFLIIVPMMYIDNQNALWNAIILGFRVLIILAIWYKWIAPYIVKKLIYPITQNNSNLAAEIGATLDVLPYLKHISLMTWNQSQGTLFTRVKTSILKLIMYSLHFTKVAE